MLRARRLDVGDTLNVTNGQGQVAVAKIADVAARRDKLRVILSGVESIPKPGVATVLMGALPKGDRQSTMLDMSTQLGMTHFYPLSCEYGVQRANPKMFERWRRIMREASKQCRQPHFPVLGDEVELRRVLSDNQDQALLLYADAEGIAMEQLFSHGRIDSKGHTIESVILLVGPEGGFSQGEIEYLEQSKAIPIALGRYVLRTETAAISMLAGLNQIRYKL